MQNCSATLFSASLYLVGILCLTRVMLRLNRRHAPACTPPATSGRNSFMARIIFPTGMLCSLGTFLFLPSGTFPAYIPCDMPVLYWLICFSIASAALAFSGRRKAGFAIGTLLVPLLLGAIHALCSWYAWRHGLPGNIWEMERFVAAPLLGHAGVVTGVGMLGLAAAAALHCSNVLTEAHSSPLLGACLELAAAQFLVCQFIPMTPLHSLQLSPIMTLTAGFLFFWVCVAFVLLLFCAAKNRTSPLSVWMLAICGSLLILGK